LNFAFGENLQAYHTRLDSPDNLSLASVKHHGLYALSLARYFGGIDLSKLKEAMPDDVFFDLLGATMVTYRQSWVIPGAMLVTLALLYVIVLNLHRSHIKIGRVIRALAASVAILLIPAIVLTIVQWSLSALLAEPRILGDSPSNAFLLCGFGLLGFSAAAQVFIWCRRKFDVLEIVLAGLVIVDALNLLLAFLLPAGSYLLFWPLLLVTCGVMATASRGPASKPGHLSLACLPGICVAVLLFAPLIYLLYVFLTLQIITVAAFGILIGLFFLIAFPWANIAIPTVAWRVPIVSLLVAAVAAFGIGIRRSHYSIRYPQRDTLLYSIDEDNHTAVWLSYDQSPDKWTGQFLSHGANRFQPMPQYLGGLDGRVLSASATVLDLPPPIVEITEDKTDHALRTIRLRIRSQRNASALRLTFIGDVNVLSMTFGDRKISPDRYPNPLRLNLLGIGPAGADVQLVIKATNRVSFWLVDQSFGLPSDTPLRPADVVAVSGSDMILVCRKYTL
jgi:hypothetical protein